MAAITDLSTLAAGDVASSDYLVIHDVTANTDYKVTKASLLATVQPTTKLQLTTTGMLAHTATFSLGAAPFGLVIVNDATSGAQGIVWLVGGANTTAVLSQRTASGISITATKNTASAVNVYFDTSAYYIQNYTGSTSQVYYLVIAA